jgi:hypothetical protein
MQSLGQDEKWENIWWNLSCELAFNPQSGSRKKLMKYDLCFPITPPNQPHTSQIHQRKQILRTLNIPSFVRDAVQLRVNPDMCAWIDERASGTRDFGVISFAFEV